MSEDQSAAPHGDPSEDQKSNSSENSAPPMSQEPIAPDITNEKNPHDAKTAEEKAGDEKANKEKTSKDLQTQSLGEKQKPSKLDQIKKWGLRALPFILGVIGIVGTGIIYDIVSTNNALSLSKIKTDRIALRHAIASLMDQTPEPSTKSPQNFAADTHSKNVPSLDASSSGDMSPEKISIESFVHKSKAIRAIMTEASLSRSYAPPLQSFFAKNKAKEYHFKSQSSFSQYQPLPASLFLVTDISGSMREPSSKAQSKLSALKIGILSMMQEIENSHQTSLAEETPHSDVKSLPQKSVPQKHLSPKNLSPKHLSMKASPVLRSALFAYHSTLDRARSTLPRSGVLDDDDLAKLVAHGGTNSTSALAAANHYFDLEHALHKEGNPSQLSLKYLVFISDGHNAGRTAKDCRPVEIWQDGLPAYWKKYGKSGGVQTSHQRPAYPRDWVYYPAITGHFKKIRQCSDPLSRADIASLKICSAMRRKNVRIYTIAYHLSGNNYDSTRRFMRYCASNPNQYSLNVHYHGQLETVLRSIGIEIAQDMIGDALVPTHDHSSSY